MFHTNRTEIGTCQSSVEEDRISQRGVNENEKGTNEQTQNREDRRRYGINLPAGLAPLVELVATQSQCTDIARKGTEVVNVDV